MADFKISGHMKVKTLKELFANEIGGTLWRNNFFLTIPQAGSD